MRNSVLLAVLCLAPLATAADDPGKDFSIQLFLQACVSSYSHASQVAAQSKAMGLAEIKGDAAASYLSGKSGRVWFGQNESGAFAVSLLREGLCSVFVHKGDGERIRAGFESWLPPPDSGITVASENIQSPPGLTTTAYTLRGGKVKEQWVLTIASAPESQLRAIMSYASQ
ncbi:MAG: hypothetical protein KJ049_13870 [Gammaproteobacteria bacterium]|nr:hypothetical protein [Gammaproteobacteria bacterium]